MCLFTSALRASVNKSHIPSLPQNNLYLFTTEKELIHDINSPLIRYHTDIEYITTFLRHTCVSSSDRHDIFNFSYEPHENVAVIHFLQKITHSAHILQLDRQLYAPETLRETPLRSF